MFVMVWMLGFVFGIGCTLAIFAKREMDKNKSNKGRQVYFNSTEGKSCEARLVIHGGAVKCLLTHGLCSIENCPINHLGDSCISVEVHNG